MMDDVCFKGTLGSTHTHGLPVLDDDFLSAFTGVDVDVVLLKLCSTILDVVSSMIPGKSCF
jgi:hypothetical protein